MQILSNETRAAQRGMLGKLRNVSGCDFVRSKLYQKYVLGLERLEAINVFGEGLNVLGLFQQLDAQYMFSNSPVESFSSMRSRLPSFQDDYIDHIVRSTGSRIFRRKDTRADWVWLTHHSFTMQATTHSSQHDCRDKREGRRSQTRVGEGPHRNLR